MDIKALRLLNLSIFIVLFMASIYKISILGHYGLLAVLSLECGAIDLYLEELD